MIKRLWVKSPKMMIKTKTKTPMKNSWLELTRSFSWTKNAFDRWSHRLETHGLPFFVHDENAAGKMPRLKAVYTGILPCNTPLSFSLVSILFGRSAGTDSMGLWVPWMPWNSKKACSSVLEVPRGGSLKLAPRWQLPCQQPGRRVERSLPPLQHRPRPWMPLQPHFCLFGNWTQSGLPSPIAS